MVYIDKIKSGNKIFYYLGKTIRTGQNSWKKIRIKIGTKKPSKELIVVSFDVPEYARRRRRWLRACLISFGFSRLHKSVWMGNYGLPKEFIDDLKDLKMLPWIHMFVAARHGTIVEDVSQERKRPGVH